MVVDLTKSQSDAVDRALDSLKKRNKLFRIGGYAGTGKTTLAKSILQEMPAAGVCAFTGKASSVLRSKGLTQASTIHSRIYKYDEKQEKFVLKSRREMQDIEYFLLDEASMVNREQWENMRSFGKPIIAIGDPGQLEPIGDDPKLMHDPDITLTEIHRQGEHSTIIQFATHIRMGKQIRKGTKGDVTIGGQDLFWDSLGWADVLLCGFNRTRVSTNAAMRKKLFGEDAARTTLIEGEKIVCLQNNNPLGFNNGEIYTVSEIYDVNDDHILCDLVSSDGDAKYAVTVLTEAFGVANPDKRFWRAKDAIYADYGYCLSVHKFQGSEADKVAVISQQCDMWCPIRHNYTAATRAAKELRFSI